MAVFVPDLPAIDAHARLVSALDAHQEAEQNAVLWFADLLRRKLYGALGYSSMQQYAVEALGFSEARFHQFRRLSERLTALPALHRSVTDGSIPWTKAREVAAVATPDTETAWVETAKTNSRRELRRKIESLRERRRAARRRKMEGQIVLEDASLQAPAGSDFHPADVEGSPSRSSERLEIMVEVTLRFTPEQLAIFEAFLEQAMKRGERGKREERVLALMALGAGDPHAQAVGLQQDTRVHEPGKTDASRRPAPASPYRIIVQACPECARGTVNTARGPLPLSLTELEALSCDAVIERKGRNRATVPPRLRRQVLARDRYRCQVAGCGRSLFLNVHHLIFREHGGANTPENLVSICSSCHRTLHQLGERRRAFLEKGGRPELQARRRVG